MSAEADAVAAAIARAVGGKVGRRAIDDGECFALADWALKDSGAKSAEDFGAITATADYVWGEAVALSDVRPGDVLQFRDYAVKTRTDAADGRWSERSEDRPHHTAVVVAVGGDGSVTVIEQNAGTASERTRVRRATFPRLAEGAETRREGSSTLTITVTGKVWAYRPVPRPRHTMLFRPESAEGEADRRMFARYSRDEGGPKRPRGPIRVG